MQFPTCKVKDEVETWKHIYNKLSLNGSNVLYMWPTPTVHFKISKLL